MEKALRFDIETAGSAIRDLKIHLQEPQLTIEIVDCDARELLGPPNPFAEGLGLLGPQTNDSVLLMLKIRINNEHRVEAAVRAGSLALAVLENSPDYCKQEPSWGSIRPYCRPLNLHNR